MRGYYVPCALSLGAMARMCIARFTRAWLACSKAYVGKDRMSRGGYQTLELELRHLDGTQEPGRTMYLVR